MIRSFYGLTRDPFDARDLQLLPQQQEMHDTLKVHCQQGGLCLVLGVPGTGKSVIKQSLQRLPDNQYLVASVSRTLHTYTNTVKIRDCSKEIGVVAGHGRSSWSTARVAPRPLACWSR